jgi:hypothetical protein
VVIQRVPLAGYAAPGESLTSARCFSRSTHGRTGFRHLILGSVAEAALGSW